ncbi:DUF2407 C-terminal domain-containing protein [Hysterangium stoloniferum]|nr:DUF2407 C-terminal domain-containing protein [Hysterangium stoloniferum]
MPLSEKAKGKQRADHPGVTNMMDPMPPQRELAVRFTEGVQDLTLYVSEGDTVRDMKTKIRAQRTEVANRRLRLIHSGRLLTDGISLYPWLVGIEERQRTQPEISKDEDGASSNETVNNNPSLIWLHCSVGPVMEVGEEDDGGTTQATQIQPLRGFDRLQAAGFSEEDIASIRRQFHSEASSNLLDSEVDGEDLDEQARALEEQWIDSIDTTGTAALSQSSSPTSSTVIQGLLLGFFFPILPFFYFREPLPPAFWENDREMEHVPSAIFTRKMQMAIILGFILNILFGLWRYMLAS